MIPVSEVSKLKGTVVTHDVWYLIDVLKELDLDIPNKFIDINLLERFLAGQPESEAQTKNGLCWDTYNILYTRYSNAENLKLLRRQFWSNEATFPDNKVQPYFFEFLEAMDEYYTDRLGSMSVEEKSTVFDVEMPVMNVFSQMQSRGISVDDEIIAQNLDVLDSEYYKILSILKDKYAFKGGPFDSSYIHEYVKKNNIDVDQYYSGGTVDQIIEYTKDYDDRMSFLHELRRLRSTKNALLKLSFCDRSIASIIFNTFGTVTGRIMAVEPPVQFIKKGYRGVIIPADGYDCLYIDYSNYEPSILAFLSQDEKLMNAVNDGGFYEFIAEDILSGYCCRDVAKTLFIQYSYGASIKTLSKYLHKKAHVDVMNSEILAKKMVDYFVGVNIWKESVIQKALVGNKAVTSDFIIRKFTNKSIKKDKAKRQIVNHHVQSAGSVHLKKLILLLNDKYPEVDILIPMFDALLLQVPRAEGDCRQKLEGLFISSFEESFNGVKAEVTISNFDD